MGPVLEMTQARVIGVSILLAIALGGCGNDKKPAAIPIKAILQAEIQKLKGTPEAGQSSPALQPDAATLAEGRRVLEEAGQPVIAVTDRSIGLATFMVPLGTNADVVTWANPEYQTIALRKGVIIATRGFGQDLMSAEAPTADVLFAGSGTYSRKHYILDGADQTQLQEYTCTLSISNNEEIVILGLNYLTKKVDENCIGSAGTFTNTYWFDTKGVIRQSRQSRMIGVENMQLQAIID